MVVGLLAMVRHSAGPSSHEDVITSRDRLHTEAGTAAAFYFVAGSHGGDGSYSDADGGAYTGGGEGGYSGGGDAGYSGGGDAGGGAGSF